MSDKPAWVARWLAKAEHDLQSARVLLDSSYPLFDMACFHAQQTAEKALKGYLTFQDTTAGRTHDLESLLEQCIGLDASFASLRKECALLNDYSVTARYPDDGDDATRRDAQLALWAAESVLGFSKAKLAGLQS